MPKMDKDGRAGFRDASDELLGRVRVATSGYPRALEAFYGIMRVDRHTNIEELLDDGLPEKVVEELVGKAFSRLEPTSQKVIQALAAYNRPVSSAAVDFALHQHIIGINSAPILERLVSMHFVRRETKRYYLHPVDREFAFSRLPVGDAAKRVGQGARARTWDRHALTLGDSRKIIIPGLVVGQVQFSRTTYPSQVAARSVFLIHPFFSASNGHRFYTLFPPILQPGEPHSKSWSPRI